MDGRRCHAGETPPNKVMQAYEARRFHICQAKYPPFGFEPPLPTGGRIIWSCQAHRQAVDRIAKGDVIRAADPEPRLL